LTPRRPGEAAFAGLLVVFSGAALWQAHGISGFSSPHGPGVFPMLAAAVMLLTAALIFFRTLRRPAPAIPLTGQVAAIVPHRLVSMLVLVALLVIGMPRLGFFPSVGLFVFAATWLLWRRGPLPALGVTVVALGAIYVTFRVVFQVVLPRGTWLQGLV